MLGHMHPVRDIDRLMEDVDEIVSSGIEHARAFSRRLGIKPATDLYDTGTALVVKALIPGARPDDISVSIEKRAVTLQGHFGYALSEEEEQSAVWYQREIADGHFADALTLPVEVEAEHAKATFANGILTLTMPKVAQARSTRIPVHGQNGRGVASPAT
jgi:HSP20 family protein